MPDSTDKQLKLGKGVFFVKSQLRYLDQEDETWEADFFPLPAAVSGRGEVWLGMVISHAHEYVLAQRTVPEPPAVNDLANLLAHAMRRPLAKFSHRPRTLYLRSKPEWAELLPHLKQVGIQVISQDSLPRGVDPPGSRFEKDFWESYTTSSQAEPRPGQRIHHRQQHALARDGNSDCSGTPSHPPIFQHGPSLISGSSEQKDGEAVEGFTIAQRWTGCSACRACRAWRSGNPRPEPIILVPVGLQ